MTLLAGDRATFEGIEYMTNGCSGKLTPSKTVNVFSRLFMLLCCVPLWVGNKKGLAWLTPFLIPFLLLSGMTTGFNTPTGLEVMNNDYVLAWNQGSIENETYYNTTSGLLQVANRLSRTKDITYVYGILRNDSGSYTYIGTDQISSDIMFATDNNSYYWINARINKSLGGGDWIINKNNSQLVNDDLVLMNFNGWVNKSYSGDFYFITGIRNLDIALDNKPETVTVLLGNGSVEQFVSNLSGVVWRGNITKIVIDGGEGTYSYDLRFPKGVIAIYNRTSLAVNGDFTFLTRIGNINANQQYSTNQYWIDVGCTNTCPVDCSFSATQTNSSGGKYTQGTFFKNVGCRYTSIGFGCGISGCTVTSDCRMEWREYINNYAQNIIIPFNDTDHVLKCENSPECVNTTILNAISKFQNIRASAIGITDLECFLQTGGGNYLSGGFTTFNITQGNVSFFLDYPSANRNESFNWTVFRSNWSGNITPDNMSLYVNGSYNYTQGGGNNLSTNLSFLEFGSWNWAVFSCYSHNCFYAALGNRTFFKHYYPLLIYSHPLNNSNLSNFSSILFEMNNTGNTTVGNITLFINGSYNNVQNETNFSLSVPFSYYGNATWNGKICLWNECKIYGNNTFIRNYFKPSPSIKKGFDYSLILLVENQRNYKGGWWFE